MNTARFVSQCLAASLATALLAFTPQLHGQTTSATPAFTILFATNGTDGGVPYNGFIQASDGNIYGANQCGGHTSSAQTQCSTNLNPQSGGDLFKITPAGDYSVIYSFSGTDGQIPQGMVEAPDGNLYGTCTWGGANGLGNIFKYNLSTGVLTSLHDFDGTAGADNPLGTIIYGDDGYLYGTTTDFQSQNGLGILWRIKLDGTGYSSLWQFGVSGGSNASTFGTYPQDGVTKVGANLYGTSEIGGPDGVGAVWYVNTSSQGVVLHDFTNASDGGYPFASPKYYSDGKLYGTSYQCNGNTLQFYGSIYAVGTSSGFSSLENATTPSCYDGRPEFDGAGNAFFGSSTSGSNSAPGGGLLDFYVPTDNVTELYTLPADMSEGLQLDSQPFIDNQGLVWTDMYDNGSDANPGAIVAFTLTPAEKSPITITATPQSVLPKTNVAIAWQSTNSFSSNEQVCFASETAGGAAGWTGLQTGAYAKGILSGSKTVTFPSTGDYVTAITCGGQESALVTEHVRYGSKTTESANPNPVAANSSTTITVAVTGNGSAATGVVALTVGGTNVGNITLSNGTGSTALSTTGLSAGTYTVTASYPGDLQYSASTATLTLTVTASSQVKTTTTLVATPVDVGAGGNVTLTATVVKQTGSGTPTGKVTFKADGETLTTVSLNSKGVASLTASTSGYANGSYTITAVYAGDSGDDASTSSAVTVKIEDATTTALTITPTTLKVGANVTLKATVSATTGGTPTGKVNFMYGTTNLGTVSLSGGVASATVSSSGYPAGTYSITAVYSGDATQAPSTSPVVKVTLTN